MLAAYQHDFSPFLIEFGNGIGLRYYGLAYALGFVALWLGLHWQIKRGWLRLSHEQVIDLVTACVLGVIVGGRVGYCLAYNFEQTLANPLILFRVWDGGMASHGGIIGVIAAMLWYAHRIGVPFYNIADATALWTPVGLGLGRVANFINGELYGRPTGGDWGWIFPDARLVDGINVARHASQLYQAALEGAVLFFVLLAVRLLWRSAWKDGAVALGFMIVYPILRIIGECYREPDSHIGYLYPEVLGGEWLTQGQLLSVAMLVAGLILAAIQFRNGVQKRQANKPAQTRSSA